MANKSPRLDDADQSRDMQIARLWKLIWALVLVVMVLALGRSGGEQLLQLWPMVMGGGAP